MTPIDLCFALNGPLVDVLLPIAMHTLIAHNNLEKVRFHFVDKDCSDSVRKYLDALPYDVTVYQMKEPPERAFTQMRSPSGKIEMEMNVIRDVAWTMEWMLKNCGYHEWAFISHFDMEQIGPLVDYYRSLIHGNIGQIGCHQTGLVGYQRRAVETCDVGMWIMDDCYMVRDSGNGRWKIRHSQDPRCVDRSFPIHGWDVGELLEIGLLYKGWHVFSENEKDLQRLRIHNGSGCGRCPEANAMIRERSLIKLKELGLEPIR